MADKRPLVLEVDTISEIASGDTVPTDTLGSGTADETTFLRGDGTWQEVSGFSTEATQDATDGLVSITSTSTGTDSAIASYTLRAESSDQSIISTAFDNGLIIASTDTYAKDNEASIGVVFSSSEDSSTTGAGISTTSSSSSGNFGYNNDSTSITSNINVVSDDTQANFSANATYGDVLNPGGMSASATLSAHSGPGTSVDPDSRGQLYVYLESANEGTSELTQRTEISTSQLNSSIETFLEYIDGSTAETFIGSQCTPSSTDIFQSLSAYSETGTASVALQIQGGTDSFSVVVGTDSSISWSFDTPLVSYTYNGQCLVDAALFDLSQGNLRLGTSGITLKNDTGSLLIRNSDDSADAVVLPQSLGTGTRDGTKFLRDDGTWQEAGGGGGEAFPVGAVFISVVSTDPSTLLGYGTWSAFGAGRVLVGLDALDPDFDTVEETGGAKTHTLIDSEMPVHTHLQDAHTHIQNAHLHADGFNLGAGSALAGGAVGARGNTALTTAVNQNTTAVNQDAGGDGAHNNLQPYIVVYMWKRTA